MLKIIFIFLFGLSLFAQNINLTELEKEIYENNNKGQYKKSQERLTILAESDEYSGAEKVMFNIYLSYTYKRLFDYTSTIKYLNIAETYASEAGLAKDSLLNIINTNKAFVLFDAQKYDEAHKIMSKLSALNYQYLAAEDLPKLNMQEAYLLFLDKKYSLAEAKYKVALQNMIKANPSDAPMILVKQMQLFDKMGKINLRDTYYKMAMQSADSYGVTTYKIYATNELLNIFKVKKDLRNSFVFQYKLDSLTSAYKIEENLAELHDQEINLVVADKDNQMSHRTWLLCGFIAFLIALALFIFFKLIAKSTAKNAIEAELDRMKEDGYVFTENYILEKVDTTEIANKSEIIDSTKISIRQNEVLALLQKGLSNKEIAEKLFISENTVKYHIKIIYTTLNLNDRKGIIKHLLQ